MGLIEALRAHSVKLAHALGQIRVRRFHQEVVVVPHLAIGVPAPVEALADTPQHLHPRLPISIVEINGLAPVSS